MEQKERNKQICIDGLLKRRVSIMFGSENMTVFMDGNCTMDMLRDVVQKQYNARFAHNPHHVTRRIRTLSLSFNPLFELMPYDRISDVIQNNEPLMPMFEAGCHDGDADVNGLALQPERNNSISMLAGNALEKGGHVTHSSMQPTSELVHFVKADMSCYPVQGCDKDTHARVATKNMYAMDTNEENISYQGLPPPSADFVKDWQCFDVDVNPLDSSPVLYTTNLKSDVDRLLSAVGGDESEALPLGWFPEQVDTYQNFNTEKGRDSW